MRLGGIAPPASQGIAAAEPAPASAAAEAAAAIVSWCRSPPRIPAAGKLTAVRQTGAVLHRAAASRALPGAPRAPAAHLARRAPHPRAPARGAVGRGRARRCGSRTTAPSAPGRGAGTRCASSSGCCPRRPAPRRRHDPHRRRPRHELGAGRGALRARAAACARRSRSWTSPWTSTCARTWSGCARRGPRSTARTPRRARSRRCPGCCCATAGRRPPYLLPAGGSNAIGRARLRGGEPRAGRAGGRGRAARALARGGGRGLGGQRRGPGARAPAGRPAHARGRECRSRATCAWTRRARSARLAGRTEALLRRRGAELPAAGRERGRA